MHLSLQTLTRGVQALLIGCAFALPISTTATDILFPLAAVLYFLCAPRGRWHRLSQQPLALSLLLFCLLYVFGLFYSAAPWSAMQHRLLQLLPLACAALLIASPIESKLSIRLLNAFLLAMIVTLVLSYVQYYFVFYIQDNFADPLLRFDRGSVFKDHIIQNFLMNIAVFIFLYRAIHRRHQRGRYTLLAILGAYNILFMSSGRSGYVIFAALLCYAGLRYFQWRGALAACAILIILGISAYTVSPEFKIRIAATLENTSQFMHGHTNTSVGIRLQSIKNAYLLFTQKPIQGHGTGSFASAYQALPPTILSEAGSVPLSYNSYLNVAVELGIIGLIGLLWMLAQQWRYSFFLHHEQRYLMHLLLLTMTLGCLGNSWLSDTTEVHAYALLLVVGFSGLVSRAMMNAPVFHQQQETI